MLDAESKSDRSWLAAPALTPAVGVCDAVFWVPSDPLGGILEGKVPVPESCTESRYIKTVDGQAATCQNFDLGLRKGDENISVATIGSTEFEVYGSSPFSVLATSSS